MAQQHQQLSSGTDSDNQKAQADSSVALQPASIVPARGHLQMHQFVFHTGFFAVRCPVCTVPSIAVF